MAAARPPQGETVGRTVARLRSFGKPNKGAPAYSLFVNRPAGRFLAAAAYHLGVSPNGVTAASGLVSLAGVVVLFTTRPTMLVGVAVAVLLAVAYALDSADGQHARLTHGGSPAGEWLDHAVDCLKINLLHVAVLAVLVGLVGLSRTDLDRGWLVVPLVFVVAANNYFFLYVITDLLRRVAAAHEVRDSRAERGVAAQPASVLRALTVLPTDYGALCVRLLTWGRPQLFVVVYAVLAAGTAGYVVLGLPKWFRDMSLLPAGR